MALPTWDLFCRVIDNHGDVGVCWRLAADLGSRGHTVRLWIDDPSALAWMAPRGAAGVTVHLWPDTPAAVAAAGGHTPGSIVIEAFGCQLPAGFIAAMAAMAQPPVWLDLEYLSAEDYVERSHRLPSPQTQGPGAGLVKRFFYPGFTPATGGLIREPGLIKRRLSFDAVAWLRHLNIERRPGERVVSLFCYAQPSLPALLDRLADAPTLLLLTAGGAARQAATWRAHAPGHANLRTIDLPLLTQTDYDHLLWSCDLNFVRGEDSFVRAQWAGTPFVWQAYPQAEGGQRVKVQAFLAHHLAGVGRERAAPIERLWTAWNDSAAAADLWLPHTDSWRRTCRDWCDRLLAQSDLASQLIRFVAEPGSAAR